jgi:pullulanase/glycogen debranching enzyme
MSDQLEELIREIAVKHGIAVARDDPILVLQTINNRLMQDSSKAQQGLLDQYKQELELLALRWGTDAKEKADRTLTAAMVAAKNEMQGILDESAHAVAQAVATEIDAAFARLHVDIRDAKRIAVCNAVAAGATFAAAAIWAFLH